jgi:PPE-repeat protein
MPMLDFGALPPEINSARMYSGPGSGPMMAAAAAWDALAAQLELYAAGYSATLSELQGQTWSGGASMAMASAAAPYVSWATASAGQAEEAAGQARAAAAAYETAFAATVPPPAVAANRMQLAILVATNFFGQNTPAIAATEAEYAEMWAQDAAAMYGYAAASSAASALAPFSEPPRTSNSGGQSAQAAAVTHAASSPAGQTQAALSQVMSAVPQQLQMLSNGASTNATATEPPAATTSILSAFNAFDTVVVGPAQPFWSAPYAVFSAGGFGTGLNLAGGQMAKAAATAAAASPADAVAPAGVRGPILVSVGQAAPVGKLSVPQSWAAANPVSGHGSEPVSLPGADFRAVPAAQAKPPGNELGAIPPARAGQGTAGVPVLRNGRRTFKMPRPLYGG